MRKRKGSIERKKPKISKGKKTMEMGRKNNPTMKGRKKNKNKSKNKNKGGKSKGGKSKCKKVRLMISKRIIPQSIQSLLESIISSKSTKIEPAYLELIQSKDNNFETKRNHKRQPSHPNIMEI